MRGRKPQPTVLKILRGNPGLRKLNPHEPKHAPLSTDVPPELVDPVAQAEWSRIAAGLIVCGQVTHVDKQILLGYCTKFAQWQALEAEARQHPFVVKAPSGYPIPNPALGMAHTAFKLMLKAAIELGITPSARSRIIATPVVGTAATKWAGMLP